MAYPQPTGTYQGQPLTYYPGKAPQQGGPPEDPSNDYVGKNPAGPGYIDYGHHGNIANTGPGDPNSNLNRETVGGQAAYWDGSKWVQSSAGQLAGAERGLGQQWAGYQGPTVDYSTVGLDRQREMEARQDPSMPSQYGALGGQVGAMQGAQGAMGMWQQEASASPQNSVAAMQARQAMGQALNNQMAAANSARGGPGAQALAARSAMQQGAQLQGQVAGQSAIAAAQEHQAALGGYSNAAQGYANAAQAYQQGISGVRGQDLQQQQLSAQQAQFQAQMGFQGAELAQKGQLGFYGLGQAMDLGQAQAQLQAEGLGVQMNSAMLGVGIDQQKVNQGIGQDIGAGVSTAGMAFG